MENERLKILVRILVDLIRNLADLIIIFIMLNNSGSFIFYQNFFPVNSTKHFFLYIIIDIICPENFVYFQPEFQSISNQIFFSVRSRSLIHDYITDTCERIPQKTWEREREPVSPDSGARTRLTEILRKPRAGWVLRAQTRSLALCKW